MAEARFQTREAVEADVDQIRDVYIATYGADYAYPQYYDPDLLKRLVYSDDTIVLVAEDSTSGQIVGAASVILDIGAYGDLVGEFGRLVVHPDARRQGIGALLMEARLSRVQDRLHVGLVEARVSHPYSQRIASAHGFLPVGFFPQKLLLTGRESVGLWAQYFGEGLSLRKNHPRVVSEAYPLAASVLENICLASDVIVDEDSAPYPPISEFAIDELTTDGYSALLRFERGRVRHREVFGSLRLHYGLFKMRAKHSNYLLARDAGRLVGAIGFTIDNNEKAVQIFELISVGEPPIRFLIHELERRCREEWDIAYLEIGVSGHAPRMQRTLVEHGFIPSAYIPALVFHDVERLDVIKMAKLLVPFDPGDLHFVDEALPIVEPVIAEFNSRNLAPRIAASLEEATIFADLTDEQRTRLATECTVCRFAPGQTVFAEGSREAHAHVVLRGDVVVAVGDPPSPVGTVGSRQCLGEISLISALPHSATAIAKNEVETASLSHEGLHALVRKRPDIGVVIYRNLARDLGKKLQQSDHRLAELARHNGNS
ncbi:MAG: GNAT family N-acetyltransferase [Planctomycetota bacterium]|nr:MAG: GNAT family N-acetyltransferase [Planctomycetota bacterium]REJ96474.1 MAG: GNAT family N-acetyltransferase [Planctomycetota bacterium]